MFMEFISRIAICLLVLNELSVKCDIYIDNERDWKITFYTGSKIWSGTDSIINAQIYGSTGKSDIKQIHPKALQLEAKSVDRFSIGPLDLKRIGNIESITISKQHSYAFFNDWELIKVELTDPDRKTYLFICKCWLTTLKYKQNIELYSIDGVRIQKHTDAITKTRSFSAFPVTVSLLLLFLMLIVFTYFGNLIANKWRENTAFITNNSRRIHHRAGYSRSGRSGRGRTSYSRNTNAEDLYKDDDDEDGDDSGNMDRVYNVTNDLTNLNTNSNLNRSSNRRVEQTNIDAQPSVIVPNLSNEDKPPDYKELFPQQNIPMKNLSQAKKPDSDPNV